MFSLAVCKRFRFIACSPFLLWRLSLLFFVGFAFYFSLCHWIYLGLCFWEPLWLRIPRFCNQVICYWRLLLYFVSLGFLCKYTLCKFLSGFIKWINWIAFVFWEINHQLMNPSFLSLGRFLWHFCMLVCVCLRRAMLPVVNIMCQCHAM